MDLWQLQIFCKVIELKSFSKAALAVHLSQPTVSSHIKDLEQHFDCILIDRLARQAVPTQSGKILYRYAKQLLRLRDEAEKALADYHGRYQGDLPIGGSTIPGNYLLPRIIGTFKNRYPQVRLHLAVGDTREIVAKVFRGEVEMGLIGARDDERHLMYTAIATDTMRLIVPPTHRWHQRLSVHVDELRAEPLIVRELGSGTRRAFEQGLHKIDRKLEDFNIMAEMGSTTAVLQAIKCGMGISILSLLAVKEDQRQGRLQALDIEGLTLERQLYLIRDKRRTASPLARVFQNHLFESLQSACEDAVSGEAGHRTPGGGGFSE
ncbi:MAG: selenium metabolism-associated LysR family transcriptional regulator [Desulfobacterales bacterium]|nr:selenium metabolism-associated LysR family transcriptional regulator [Desulfobacterales bacterium]